MGNDKEKLKALALRMHAEDQEDQTALLTRGEIQAFNALLEEWEDATRAVTILALLAEIEELQKAVELHAGYHAKADEFDRIQVENEALRKDAERYRWLTSPAVYNGTLGIADGWIDFEDKIEAQQQIDAAMAEQVNP